MLENVTILNILYDDDDDDDYRKIATLINVIRYYKGNLTKSDIHRLLTYMFRTYNNELTRNTGHYINSTFYDILIKRKYCLKESIFRKMFIFPQKAQFLEILPFKAKAYYGIHDTQHDYIDNVTINNINRIDNNIIEFETDHVSFITKSLNSTWFEIDLRLYNEQIYSNDLPTFKSDINKAFKRKHMYPEDLEYIDRYKSEEKECTFCEPSSYSFLVWLATKHGSNDFTHVDKKASDISTTTCIMLNQNMADKSTPYEIRYDPYDDDRYTLYGINAKQEEKQVKSITFNSSNTTVDVSFKIRIPLKRCYELLAQALM